MAAGEEETTSSFEIKATHEDGYVSASIEIVEGDANYKFGLGYTIGPLSKNYLGEVIKYVDFIEALRDGKDSSFLVYDEVLCWTFFSDSDGYLTIKASSDNSVSCIYSISFPMTNEIFSEMEKLIIKSKRRCCTPELSQEWEETYFPKDYVYGRGLSYE